MCRARRVPGYRIGTLLRFDIDECVALCRVTNGATASTIRSRPDFDAVEVGHESPTRRTPPAGGRPTGSAAKRISPNRTSHLTLVPPFDPEAELSVPGFDPIYRLDSRCEPPTSTTCGIADVADPAQVAL